MVQGARLKDYMDTRSHSFDHRLVRPLSEEFHDLIEDHLKLAGFMNFRIPTKPRHQVLIAKL
jgi:hypothetical protein